jgi:hypothetical protein
MYTRSKVDRCVNNTNQDAASRMIFVVAKTFGASSVAMVQKHPNKVTCMFEYWGNMENHESL